MELSLKEKSVLVTGGNRGIGLAIALAFADEGANVAICGRDIEGSSTHWLRELAVLVLGSAGSSYLKWEEVATFHLGGLLGNMLVFRAFVLLAAMEAAEGGATAPRGWLETVLLETVHAQSPDSSNRRLALRQSQWRYAGPCV